MLKKAILIFLSACLIFSITATAENIQETNGEIPQSVQGEAPSQMPPMGEMPRSGRPSGDFAPPQNNGAESANAQQPQENAQHPQENAQHPQGDFNAQGGGQMPGRNPWNGGQMPNGFGGFGNMQNNQNTESQPKGFWGFVKTYATPITSVILLILAFIFVIFYKRKNY